MAEILILSEQEVRSCLEMADAIEAVERAFADFAEGATTMPAKLYLDFPGHNGDLRIMPAAKGAELAGVKVVNSHPRNPERGLPAVVGTYILVSQETGMPLAFMGATHMTGVRTGAASAVATKYLARRDARHLGLVGSGAQARYQLEAISHVAELRRVSAWSPPSDRERLDRFVADMQSRYPDIQVAGVDTVAEAAGADIVCTTTPAREPVVFDQAVAPGAHVNAVGADGPGKQELDPAILRRARLIVDEWEQARHGGEVNVPLATGDLRPEDITGSLSDVVSGRIPGRESGDDLTVFDSTGLAIEDIATAALVYANARDRGLGHSFQL